MARIKVVIYECDNPICPWTDPADPQPQFKPLGYTVQKATFVGSKTTTFVTNIYACSSECVGPALAARVEQTQSKRVARGNKP